MDPQWNQPPQPNAQPSDPNQYQQPYVPQPLTPPQENQPQYAPPQGSQPQPPQQPQQYAPPQYGQQPAQYAQPQYPSAATDPPPQYPQQPPQGMPPQATAFDHTLVTTAFELPAVTIARNFGLVRGIIVRSRSIVGNIGAAFQTVVGGNISIYTNLCEQARQETYELMIQHAAQLGANGVIGVRYDTTEVGQGITEFLCYGTAVYVSPTNS